MPPASLASPPKAGLPAAANPRSLYAPATSTTGTYQLSWNVTSGTGVLYELQQADDSNFTQNVTTIYSGVRNYTNLTTSNGTRYYRVRAARSSHQPSSWTLLTAPVVVDLTCGRIAGVYAPASNSSGSYQLSWNVSATKGVSYDVEVDDGSGYKYLTSTTSNYLNLNNLPNGSYRYRVVARKTGYKPSSLTTSAGTIVTLACANIAGIYSPVSNTTGGYQISWSKSSTAGVTYKLFAGATEIYSGANNYFNITGKINGTYSYTVKATKTGYADSATKGPVSTTVTLTCGNISGIYAPASNTTGGYQISWSKSSTAGVTYKLFAGATEIYSGANNYFNITGKINGSYSYTVKATKTGYADSATKGPVSTTVTLTCGNIAGIYAPVSNTTGGYQISWSKSSTAGVTYVLTENGSTIYTGTNNYFNVTGKATAAYSYTTQATKSGYINSAVKGGATVTVTR